MNNPDSGPSIRFRSSPRGWRRGLGCLLAVLGWIAFSSSVRAQSDLPLEYQVKTGYLFNFAKFVDWPAGVLPEGATLEIGIIAPPEITDGISRSLADKAVLDHPISVRPVNPEAPGAPPHILFIHRSSAMNASDATALFPNSPVLIVGEVAGFAGAGGIIGFVSRGDTLRFQVNIRAASAADLKLSSQLANLAEVVRTRR